jgi:carboxyl-terminal processing protease
MKKLLILTVIFTVLLISCKKGDVSPGNTVTPEMARDSLYYIMKEWYYWYNMTEATNVTESNKGNYKNPYELLEAMRYRALDRWSFVADYNEFLGEYQGDFVGHGIRIGLAQDGTARIGSIYNKSPLYASGVRRGWIIEKVNNVELAPLLLANDETAYDNLMGAQKEGITNIFLFKKPSGDEITISSTKTSFSVNTVLKSDTLQLITGTTGHLVLDQFIDPTADELAQAFAYFMGVGVKDFILDLRYNTGGLLSGAQLLASYIAGNALQGKVFARYHYNDKHADQDARPESINKFITTSYPLGLSRIVIITTRSTASASEAVINGLKPFVNVLNIGDTTNGKPTGMNIWDIGEKYIAAPVTFKIVNSKNEGDYYAGFPPAKVAPDDITYDFSDRQEACLKEAIYYLEHGSVSTKGVQQFKSYKVFSEKPKWMNNAFAAPKNLILK